MLNVVVGGEVDFDLVGQGEPPLEKVREFYHLLDASDEKLHGHTHYRKRVLCRVPEALGKALKTLGKTFVECHTRQRRLGKQCIGKAFFAEYFFWGTRQRGLPSAREHSAKKSSRYGAG
jgi:hypothetical protein